MHVVGYILISSLRHRGFRCSPFRDGSDATVRYKRKRGTASHVNPDVEKEEAKNLDIVASSLADSAGRFVFFFNERKSEEWRTKYKLCFFFITKAKG